MEVVLPQKWSKVYRPDSTDHTSPKCHQEGVLNN